MISNKKEVLGSKELMFHFNVAHIEDSLVPAWMFQAKGETYYVKSIRRNAQQALSGIDVPNSAYIDAIPGQTTSEFGSRGGEA